MYTLNAKRQGWFDEVTLIVWGPSSKLLSEERGASERLCRDGGSWSGGRGLQGLCGQLRGFGDFWKDWGST